MNSQRIPGKMLKPFANTTLLDILFNKLSKSKFISKNGNGIINYPMNMLY